MNGVQKRYLKDHNGIFLVYSKPLAPMPLYCPFTPATPTPVGLNLAPCQSNCMMFEIMYTKKNLVTCKLHCRNIIFDAEMVPNLQTADPKDSEHLKLIRNDEQPQS
jgi:hypothetical protein